MWLIALLHYVRLHFRDFSYFDLIPVRWLPLAHPSNSRMHGIPGFSCHFIFVYIWD